MKKNFIVVMTGAAGQLAYQTLPLLCSGQIFGEDVSISLRLQDLEQCVEELQGIKHELEECGFKNLKEVHVGHEPRIMFKDAEIAIFIGGFPRKPGMERIDLLEINGAIFKFHGKILNDVANPDCKVLVVANPVNTNCLILQQACPKLKPENFTCLTGLAVKRALGYKQQIGNFSQTLFPDLKCVKIKNVEFDYEKDRPFYQHEFIAQIQRRGSEVIALKKSSSIMAGATAIKEHLNLWYKGDAEDKIFSLGLITQDNKSYDIQENLCISLPVKLLGNFKYKIVNNLELDEFQKEKILITMKELMREKEIANLSFKNLNQINQNHFIRD